jgi:signal transduction histidine kinase
MQADDLQESYASLRSLSFSDPLAAKKRISSLLEQESDTARSLFGLASANSDSRVRQIIARCLHRHPNADRFSDLLQLWRETETDEFTLLALNEALATAPTRSGRVRKEVDLPDLAHTFRYVSARLRHRILNLLPRCGVCITQISQDLRHLECTDARSDLVANIGELRSLLQRVERAVDFAEEEAHFAPRQLHIAQWIEMNTGRFISVYGRAVIVADISRCKTDPQVWGSDYLLDQVFTNLWLNSVQAVDGRCEITNTIEVDSARVRILIHDNGPGMSAKGADAAFELQYSSKGLNRGRGHLEVSDAMKRMGGDAQIYHDSTLGRRVRLTFPRYTK